MTNSQARAYVSGLATAYRGTILGSVAARALQSGGIDPSEPCGGMFTVSLLQDIGIRRRKVGIRRAAGMFRRYLESQRS